MRKPITLYKGGGGLYTREDPTRLEFDSENGVGGLAIAVNVVISDTKRVSRRGGFTLVDSTYYHSPFPLDSTRFIAVYGTSLRIVSILDFSYTELTTVTRNATVSYAKVGPMILWCNGYEVGIIEDNVNSAWTVGTYHGPDTARSQTFVGPPLGTQVFYYAETVFMVKDNVLWYSEPGAINLFCPADGFLYYGSDIQLVAPVSTGIYLSTSNRIIYLGGDTPRTLKETPLTDYPAIKGTNAVTSGLTLPKSVRNPELVNIFTTTNGICAGGSDKAFGSIMFDNFTIDRFDYPSGLEGSATIIDNTYIVNIYK